MAGGSGRRGNCPVADPRRPMTPTVNALPISASLGQPQATRLQSATGKGLETTRRCGTLLHDGDASLLCGRTCGMQDCGWRGLDWTAVRVRRAEQRRSLRTSF